MLKLLAFILVFAPAVFAQVGLELFPQPFPPLGRGTSIHDGVLVCDGPRAATGASLELKPEWGKLKLSTSMRVTDLVSGDNSWENGRLTMQFVDAAGKMVGDWPDVFGFAGTADWTPCERIYRIPEGAARLNVGLCNLGKSGKVFFKPVSIKVHAARLTEPCDAPLPEGAPADSESLAGAERVKTKTQERICLNGLWKFRPVMTNDVPNAIPASGDCWGWIKVPAPWAYQWERERAVQAIHFSPWIEEKLPAARTFDEGWYKRTFALPANWQGRRVLLDFKMLHTHAEIFCNGKPAGELWFPGGELDVTDALPAAGEVEFAFKVSARPLNLVSASFSAPDRVEKTKASVKFRGITGDLFLTAVPKAQRLADVQIVTSVKDHTISFAADTVGLGAGPYRLTAEIAGCGEKRFFTSGDLRPDTNGVLRFSTLWRNPKLWDLHTPENRYAAQLTLADAKGKPLDALVPVEFGFREFEIRGRDFYLNGTPVHLRALHNTTVNSTADAACESSALEMCRRVKEYGFNFLILGNYDFEPGSVSYLDGFLNACDRSGVLSSFSMPHIKEYDMDLNKPEVAAQYEALCRKLARLVRNRPSVILYAANHNATGYFGDQNPLKIDGVFDMPADSGKKNAWWEWSRKQAMISDDLIKQADPARPVYHHQSGNLGDLHTVNIYLNWAPIQERSDWLYHWSTNGVKPVFFVEWGLPHISSWSSHRGPGFIWRCKAFQSLWVSEYAAQFRGDAAYEATPEAYAALAHEEKLWARGQPFAWSELNRPLHGLANNYHGIQALFASDNWRSFRAHGLSAGLPWDQGVMWTRVKDPAVLPVAKPFDGLKQPGIRPDNLKPDDQYIFDTGPADAFAPSVVGNVFLRWNQPDCAFIGGPLEAFTDKQHHYRAGETLRKSLVIVNDRRTSNRVKWRVRLTDGAAEYADLSGRITVEPGSQRRVPVEFALPAKPGTYTLEARFVFEGDVRQSDSLALRIYQAPDPVPAKFKLYDPKGLTRAELERLGVTCESVGRDFACGEGETLLIGRESLDAAVWARMKESKGKILLFEQSAKALYEIAGLRINERGGRLFFPAFKHPATAGLDADDFRDWAGASTLLAPFLTDIDPVEFRDPGWKWCGGWSTRVWRCGNRGSVCSVPIEIPCNGDWRPLLRGEFDLQYSPLLEYIHGNGRWVFSQLDFSGRGAADPAGDLVIARLLNYLAGAQPEPRHPVKAVGEQAKKLCAQIGVRMAETSPIVFASEAADVKGAKAVVWAGLPGSGAATNRFFARMEEIPAELNGLCNADWAWHGSVTFSPATEGVGHDALRILRKGSDSVAIQWQVPPWALDAEKRPYLRSSLRRANCLFSRMMANLGAEFDFPANWYADKPETNDNPYRYYRW